MMRLASPSAGWNSRIRELTLGEAARLLPVVTVVAALVSVALVALKIWLTPHFAHFRIVATIAGSAVALSLILGAVLFRLTTSRRAWVSASGVTAWVLALDVGILMLVIPVLLAVKAAPEDDMTGWMWPLVNKRWLLALYNIAIATFVVFPVAIERLRSGSDSVVQSTVQVVERSKVPKPWYVLAVGQIVIVALCWYLAGPPWQLERYHRGIEWHEQMHFGPLQAIAKGYLPSVGPAATPYGAGSQILIVTGMKILGGFDLVSFRMAWVTQNLLGVLVVGTVAYWWLGLFPAVAVMLLASLYSPLAFFYTLVDGTLAGFFGWANPLRYLAPLVVVPALAGAATSDASDSRTWKIVLLGGVWGLGAWLAQENLTTTAASAVLLLTMLWLTRTVSLSRATWLLRNLAVGFACVAIPVLLYYARHGAAMAFLQAYFFFARAVAVGFSNMWWPLNEGASPERFSYYFTFPLLVAVAICAVWRLPALQLVAPLSRRRAIFLAFVCVQLVCYQTALLRSDSTHVMNTMIALPFILVLGFIDLPGWLVQAQTSRWLVRMVLVALALAVYPTLQKVNLRTVTDPARRFRAVPTVPASNSGQGSDALARVRPLLPSEPLFLGEPISVDEFLASVAEIRAIVGHRKAYFLTTDWVAGGLIAFLADLTPAPHPLGGDLLTINDSVRLGIAEDIRAHPERYEAFVGPSLDKPEARAFLESHHSAVRFELALRRSTVHILLSER